MPLSLANQRLVNPTTGISYRLMADAEKWRITRSSPVGSVVSLVHLKGKDGAGVVAPDVISRFIAGYGVEALIVAPSSAAFRSIVLADFIATSDHLMTAVMRARNAYNGGMPGFRPRSPATGKRLDEACRAITDGWQALAMAWSDGFGREDAAGLPDWMVAVWEGKIEGLDRAEAIAALRGK
jgi:hypothetical protein